MTFCSQVDTDALSTVPTAVRALSDLSLDKSRSVVQSARARGEQGPTISRSAVSDRVVESGYEASPPRRRGTNGIFKAYEADCVRIKKTSEVTSADALSDRDLLVALLSQCLSLTKAAEATEAILKRYGSYADAVAAPLHELRAIAPVGDNVAMLLKCVHSSVAHLTSLPLRKAPVFKDWPTLSAYLNVCLGRERNEYCRALFLNAKNHLITDQIMAEGDSATVQVPVRTITRRALELGAVNLIVVHNHPSGDPTPSEIDIATTDQLSHAISLFGIVMQDHVIVGQSCCYSLKRREYLASYQPTDKA